MHRDRQRRQPEFVERAAIEVGERHEAGRRSADDRQRERQVVAGRPHHRLRTAADADPGRQPALFDRRVDTGDVERRARAALPLHRAVLEQGREKIELLLEQHVVVLQVEAEERERLGERAAAHDHLGAAVRDRVQRREALEDADRIVGAEHGDGRPQVNPRGARGDGGQQHLGCRDGEVGAVMFTDAEA